MFNLKLNLSHPPQSLHSTVWKLLCDVVCMCSGERHDGLDTDQTSISVVAARSGVFLLSASYSSSDLL